MGWRALFSPAKGNQAWRAFFAVRAAMNLDEEMRCSQIDDLSACTRDEVLKLVEKACEVLMEQLTSEGLTKAELLNAAINIGKMRIGLYEEIIKRAISRHGADKIDLYSLDLNSLQNELFQIANEWLKGGYFADEAYVQRTLMKEFQRFLYK
jgi:hypothetical protein